MATLPRGATPLRSGQIVAGDPHARSGAAYASGVNGGSTRTIASVPRGSWFGDAWWPKRLIALLALIGGSAAVLGALVKLVGAPPDFNGAQSAPARELLQQPAWPRPLSRLSCGLLVCALAAVVLLAASVLRHPDA